MRTIQQTVVWADVLGNLSKFALSQKDISLGSIVENRYDDSALSFYKLLLTPELLQLLVRETNRFAEQKIISGITNESIAKNSMLVNWYETNEDEMLTFLGVIIWMGLNPKPRLKDFWSTNFIHKCDIYKTTHLSRNRFEALLACLHFSNNEICPEGNRLFKLEALLKICNANFQAAFTPGEYVCIDESMVPFRGRLSFLQYIPGKRHKYGIKIFKLCGKGGYTYNIKIYGGKETRPTNQPVASQVVMELIEPLLHTGRTLVTDNYYTSVTLAHQLNDNNIHLIGTLRRNRKFNPKPIFDTKLKRGEMLALESNTKVIVGKWSDKRDVAFLTTKSAPEMVQVQNKHGIKYKPSTILEYNSVKSYIDVSDQKSSYSTPVRRSIKWYRKVVVEFLTGTMVVNALILYNTALNKNLDITTFREELIVGLCKKPEPVHRPTSHRLEEYDKRGRCVICYSRFAERYGRAHASQHSKQCNTKCTGCPNQKFLCFNCFFSEHNVSLK